MVICIIRTGYDSVHESQRKDFGRSHWRCKENEWAGGKLFNEAIGQMSSTIVREEDKRKEEKEIKSDTGTMIDQSIVTNKNIKYY